MFDIKPVLVEEYGDGISEWLIKRELRIIPVVPKTEEVNFVYLK